MCGNSKWRRPQIVNIYLLQVGNSCVFKIGYTSNKVEERLRVIKYYIPDISLIDWVRCDFKYEKYLHELFEKHRIGDFRGGFREYFAFDRLQVNEIEKFFKEIKDGKRPSVFKV